MEKRVNKKSESGRILRKYDGKKQEWLRTGVQFAVLLVIVFILFRWVVGFSMVDGVSMSPTLEDRDIVFYTRIVPKLTPGDVVSVKMPSGEYYVKRVVAVAGDTVDLHDGSLFVNGQEVVTEQAVGKTYPEDGNVQYPYQVEDGKVFVLGDNREASVDSRTFGAVVMKQVKGKLLFIK